jgi:hypothetical protein
MSWTLNNGLIKIEPAVAGPSHDAGGGHVLLRVSHWDGNAWLDAKDYHVAGDFGHNRAFDFMTVIINSPEVVIIRLGMAVTTSPATSGRHLLDLQLRRGARFVQCFIQSDQAQQWGIKRDPLNAEPSDDVPGGGAIEADNFDADGAKYLLMTSKAYTRPVGEGSLIFSSGGKFWDFGIGLRVPGATGYDSNQSQVQQYMAASTERPLYSAQDVLATS